MRVEGDRPFLDTNVLIYATLSGDPRRERAETALLAGGLVGVQVMNEFASVARRKLGRTWEPVLAELDLSEGLCRPVQPLTLATHRSGLALAHHHGPVHLRRDDLGRGAGGRV